MNSYEIKGSSGLPLTFDIDFPDVNEPAPLIVFLHGFKGFKDWGQWPMMAKDLSRRGFAVLRLNFSHNGTTPSQPFDFADLEAFGHNTFSKESQDVQNVIDWLFKESSLSNKIDLNQLNIVAHSRGGAIAMITANEDARVKKIVSLSGVGTLQRFSADELEHWKKAGVVYALNGRTNQNMPLYYDLAKDFFANEKRFTITDVVTKIKQPYLIIHAESDETVPMSEAEKLESLGINTTLAIIPNANHSFGGMHPFIEKELPIDTLKAVEEIVRFL
jgi:pimeloyl-ACP methyl ester carboxylesterase